MKNLKKYSLFSLLSIILWIGVLAGASYYFADQLLCIMSGHIDQMENIKTKPEIEVSLNEIIRLLKDTKEYFLPLLINLFILTALIIWIFTRFTINWAVKSFEKQLSLDDNLSKQKKDHSSEKAKKNKKQEDKSKSLLLLSLLQRQGRFIDFLEENLDDFSDEQIGSAVRNIHENCKKVVQKHLGPKSIIEQQEGDEVTIQKGFDTSQIKLIGNVSGEPPFKGILRHKGWRASRYEMPSISSARNPDIIAPAEVEIS